MATRIFTGICYALILLVVEAPCGFSQEVKTSSIRVMFYNVENLFDIYDDTAREDEEFLPGGVMRWSLYRYNRKINSLYKTIVAAGEWSPPSIVALCEVENRKALEDLIHRTYLSKYRYEIVHEESPDFRGIDVCMIYRNDIAHLAGYKYWDPPGNDNGYPASRSVLYTKFQVGQDTLHLIVNHWPSKRGGALAANDLRKSIAVMVRRKIDSIFSIYGNEARIIVTGDFNCTPDDIVMSLLTASDDPGCALVNLSARPSFRGVGTYRYSGVWEMIDQVIVSDGLLSRKGGINTDFKNLTIFSSAFLLERDSRYPGLTPYPTYRGYKYQGGFSDHLPVIIDLDLPSPSQEE